ncbi:hypothetical protein VE03_09313 [Pseudogymnoascus sp. 23342-1-I1]|nr:hypothetical protein VE03_09313 [Pseudogymnoascus sp. 23342-1-I1]
MTSLLAKYISKKFLGESLKNNFGTEDPYFESVPATRLNGKPSGKMKKVRKALPPGISEHDGKVLTKVKRRAYRLDMSLFNCCGIRFGWSSVIGIIPGFGDALDAFMAMMVYRTCQQVEGGLPAAVQSQMILNIVVDFFIGLVPFLGDLADAVFRANTKNAAVLEKHLRTKGQARLKAQGAVLPAVDPSDPDEFDRMMASNGPPPVYTADEPSQQPPMRQTAPTGTTQGQTPLRTTNTAKTTQKSGGGWFGSWGKKSKQPDVESGAGRRHGDTPLSDLPTRPAGDGNTR